MIITDSVYVTITPKNINHFNSLGYDTPIGYNLLVNVSELNKGSHCIIKCKCDNCGIEKEMMYKTYLSYNNEKFGEYYCRKCSQYKMENTNIIKYGVKYPLQNKEIYEKMEETNFKRYKVKNVSQIK